MLYNPRSHALSITSASAGPAVVVTRSDHDSERCPYCKQRLPAGFEMYEFGRSMRMNANDERVVGSGEVREENQDDQDSGRWGEGRWDHGHRGVYDDDRDDEFETLSTDPAYHSRASDYFRLLAIANERSTGGISTPHGAYRVGTSSSSFEASDSGVLGSEETHRRNNTTTVPDDANNAFPADKMAEGYFKTFFQEEYKLGMGANGSVFLCQVHIYIYMYVHIRLLIIF